MKTRPTTDDGARLRLPDGGGDWTSRKSLAHRVALRWKPHAVEALEEAFARNGPPDVGGTPRVASSRRHLHRGRAEPRRAAVDGGQGAWRDNVFLQRGWRSIKYEEI